MELATLSTPKAARSQAMHGCDASKMVQHENAKRTADTLQKYRFFGLSVGLRALVVRLFHGYSRNNKAPGVTL
jgi:hypothetical protein